MMNTCYSPGSSQPNIKNETFSHPVYSYQKMFYNGARKKRSNLRWSMHFSTVVVKHCTARPDGSSVTNTPKLQGCTRRSKPPRPLLGKYLSHSVAYISINIYFHEQTAFYSDHWLTADSYMSAQPHNWYLAASFNTPVQPCSYLPIIQCFISHQCFFYIHLIKELSLYCPPQQCNNTAVLAATSDPSFTCCKVLRKIRIPVGRCPLKPCDTIPKPKINRFTIYN